ncbi:guanine deaminase [Obba rivulosa]|uniref:Probable guanine deaminase n=1 Tax=Obba rivulosa TaxID=1052685 RepID=A0A8E2J2R5_9APHY|nr:guanine deaminase [Obba rivulosa]
MIPSSTVFYGALISPTSLTTYLALPHALISVSPAGEIEWLEHDVPASQLQDVLARHGLLSDIEIVELRKGEFLIPGFIDTHTHAPQVPNMGSGQEHELLDWLAEVTFPMEARFADVGFARRAYPSVVRRYIDSGTTTCCYYGTLHLESTKALAEIVHANGQRAFVGKCNMDRNSPDYYIEPSPQASVQATLELIAHIRSLPRIRSSDHGKPSSAEALVRPVLTPRFAISCSPELLASLGALAESDRSLAIQTHISENESEVVFTKSLFPPEVLPAALSPVHGPVTYAGVYEAYGLLRENTILAHAVHLEPTEVDIIKRTRAGVSHCPTSNFNLRSGCAKIGILLDEGIKVGLGTDVSGGFSPSILTAVQHASICSKVVALQSPSDSAVAGAGKFASRQLPVATLLHLATLGGAQVCNLADRIGSLAPGKAFDALVVSVRSDAGNPALWGVDLDQDFGLGQVEGEGGRHKSEKELEAMLERFLFCGDDRNIRRVYVQGRLIGGKEFMA